MKNSFFAMIVFFLLLLPTISEGGSVRMSKDSSVENIQHPLSLLSASKYEASQSEKAPFWKKKKQAIKNKGGLAILIFALAALISLPLVGSIPLLATLLGTGLLAEVVVAFFRNGDAFWQKAARKEDKEGRKGLNRLAHLSGNIALGLFGLSLLSAVAALVFNIWGIVGALMLISSGLSVLNLLATWIFGLWGIQKLKPAKAMRKTLLKKMLKTSLLSLAALFMPLFTFYLGVLFYGF